MVKNSTKRDQYTAVLEDIRSHNQAFGEGLSLVRDKVNKLDKHFDRVESDLELIKGELALIHHNQVTREEFKFLETRVLRMEKQRQ